MPNKKSAKRRVLVAERNRIYNRYWTTRCKNAVKKVLEAVDAQNSEEASKNLVSSDWEHIAVEYFSTRRKMLPFFILLI